MQRTSCRTRSSGYCGARASRRRHRDLAYLLRVLRHTLVGPGADRRTAPDASVRARGSRVGADQRRGSASSRSMPSWPTPRCGDLSEPLRRGDRRRRRGRALLQGGRPRARDPSRGTIMSRLFRAREQVAAALDGVVTDRDRIADRRARRRHTRAAVGAPRAQALLDELPDGAPPASNASGAVRARARLHVALRAVRARARAPRIACSRAPLAAVLRSRVVLERGLSGGDGSTSRQAPGPRHAVERPSAVRRRRGARGSDVAFLELERRARRGRDARAATQRPLTRTLLRAH